MPHTQEQFNSEPEWKEKFREHATEGCYNHQVDYISTEVVEKIIEDIPDQTFMERLSTGDLTEVDVTPLKQQLKSKYL